MWFVVKTCKKQVSLLCWSIAQPIQKGHVTSDPTTLCCGHCQVHNSFLVWLCMSRRNRSKFCAKSEKSNTMFHLLLVFQIGCMVDEQFFTKAPNWVSTILQCVMHSTCVDFAKSRNVVCCKDMQKTGFSIVLVNSPAHTKWSCD